MAEQVTDPNKPGDGTPNPNDKKPVELTPEQQEHVNKVFNARFAKIESKHEEEMKALKTQLDSLTKKDDPPPGKKDEEDSAEKKQFKGLLDQEKTRTKNAELLAAQNAREAKEAREESMRTRKEVAISRAAQKQNFYENDVVTKMIWDSIEWDEDSKNFIVKENGVVKQNSSLQNMTLEEFLTDFAAKRPYLVNGDVKGGIGSAENRNSNSSGAGLIKSKADLKTAKDKSEFIGKFGLAKYEALPLK
jgi:hypothetical protein